MGALSFSPSPITTTPSMAMLESTIRMALTAAPSAPSLSPRPIHRDAASAAASVTRTSSMARLRSGAWGAEVTEHDDSGCATGHHEWRWSEPTIPTPAGELGARADPAPDSG